MHTSWLKPFYPSDDEGHQICARYSTPQQFMNFIDIDDLDDDGGFLIAKSAIESFVGMTRVNLAEPASLKFLFVASESPICKTVHLGDEQDAIILSKTFCIERLSHFVDLLSSQEISSILGINAPARSEPLSSVLSEEFEPIDISTVDAEPALLLTNLFVFFALCHEFAHVANGHTRYLNEAPALKDCPPEWIWQTLEYDADVYALREFSWWVSKQPSLQSLAKNSDSMLNEWLCLALSPYLLVRSKHSRITDALSIAGDYELKHPNPIFRYKILCDGLNPNFSLSFCNIFRECKVIILGSRISHLLLSQIKPKNKNEFSEDLLKANADAFGATIDVKLTLYEEVWKEIYPRLIELHRNRRGIAGINQKTLSYSPEAMRRWRDAMERIIELQQ
jgi:hypothetical protein